MARVLLTGFAAVPGPRRAGVQLRHVIRALTPLHALDVLVAREGEQAYVERQGAVRVLRVPMQEAGVHAQIQGFQRALKRQLEGADYDIVHCRDGWSGIPVLEARSRLGYAVVYDLSRSPLGETSLEPALSAQYARDEESCLLAADLVLAPTAAAVKALQGRGRPERVMLSPPGVDVDRFDWDDVPTSGPPRIVYVGAVDPGRGVRVLVRAMAAIAREVDARLVLAGPIAPSFEQPLREAIRELGLTGKVDVLGAIDHEQLPALLATATVCVVPAAADPTPNPTVAYPTKLLEYMACRCAIVAPLRETISQVVEHNREALLFAPGDPLDLARKVLRLLGEPGLRRNLAQNAYERVRRELTASASRRAIRAAYRVLVERFADQLSAAPPDESASIALLADDDDFEATVCEEAPASPQVDTAVSKLDALDEALAALEEPAERTSSELRVPVRPAPESDETMERAPVPPRARAARAWDAPGPRAGAGGEAQDDWVVTHAARALDDPPGADAERDELADGDDGTPIQGVRAEAPALPMLESTFVAGEIDVPTPPPERAQTVPMEFEAAAPLLGPVDPADPDTGSRPPAPERW